jgi:cytochrome c5
MRRQKLATVLAAFLLAALLTAIPAASVRADEELPDGPGKDIVLKVCTPCHGTAEFTAKKNTRMEWDEEIDKMAARGAKASDDEFDAIVTYLAKYFGKE